LANCATIQHVAAALKARTDMSDYDRGAWLRDAKYGYTWAVINKADLESKRRKFPLFTLIDGIHITGPLQEEMIRNARHRHRVTKQKERDANAKPDRGNLRVAVGCDRGHATRPNSIESNHPMVGRIAEIFGGEWLDYGITRGAGAADGDERGSAVGQGASGRDGQAQTAESHSSNEIRDRRATAVRNARRRIQSVTARGSELQPPDGQVQRLAHAPNGGDGNPSVSTTNPADIGGPF
jgi:hypothetical protein